MLWAMTGYCSDGDGLLYVIEAETEQEVYQKVAQIRKLKYARVENRPSLQPTVKTGKGLDDEDEFGGDLWFDVLLFTDDIPTFDDIDNGYYQGFVCNAAPVELNQNLSDVVQW